MCVCAPSVLSLSVCVFPNSLFCGFGFKCLIRPLDNAIEAIQDSLWLFPDS